MTIIFLSVSFVNCVSLKSSVRYSIVRVYNKLQQCFVGRAHWFKIRTTCEQEGELTNTLCQIVMPGSRS
jgi:hypothetical protein